VDATDEDGWTALYRARKKGHTEIVTMLKNPPPKPPPKCMSQEVFDTCNKNEKGVPECGIMYTDLTKENAVRTHPPPPHKEGEEPNTTACFNRTNLRRHLTNSELNPVTNLPIKKKWIKDNMDDKDCEPQTGGKRKTRKRKC
jgi:hypothetical protein